MVDDLYSNPRIGERHCKCGEIKILSHAFCGGHVCRTQSQKAAIERTRSQQAALTVEIVSKRQQAREQKIEIQCQQKEAKLRKQEERKEQKAAEKKRLFKLNTRALKGVLVNAEKKRDAEAKTLLVLQKKQAGQAIIDRQIKKYQSTNRAVKKAQADLTKHKRSA